ncbi:MAG: hypothetical protein JXR20_06010 [Balneola sp.]
MKFVTVATHKNRNFELFQESATQQGVKFDVLGWNEEYTSHNCKSAWLIDYLKDLPDDEIVFFTDSYDALLLANEEEIYEKFLEFEHPFVMSTEQNFNYGGKLIDKVKIYNSLKKGKKPYQFLNSGGWIGECRYAEKLLKEISNPNKYDHKLKSDQSSFNKLYSKNNSLLVLDDGNKIFTCTAGRTGLEDLDYSVKNNRIINNNTNTAPCIIHFAGKNFTGANYLLSSLPNFGGKKFDTDKTTNYKTYKLKNRLIDLTCKDNFLFHQVAHILIIILILLVLSFLAYSYL